MSTTIEHLGPCKKLLRVEVEAAAVDKAFDATRTDFARHVTLPGFRPGKAPQPLVQRTFADRIAEEVKRKLLNESYRQALDEHKLRPVSQPQIEEIQFGPGQAMIFTATVETEPQFELPDYTGLAVRRENRVVTDEDVERALNSLREQKATFADVERPVQTGDFVVVNYTGTCDGKPITETVPTAKGLTQQTNFWLHVQTEHFIPGFTDQLVGANKGEKRTVTVTFPQDFVARELSGKVGVYEVEVVQVKEKIVPALDDALAQAYGAENLEKLKEGVRKDLDNELKTKIRRDVRNQLVAGLLGRVTVDLPDSMVELETRGAVYDIVRANAERGVPKEAIDEKKDEIYTVASNNARERLKVAFLLGRIAEKESIKVTDQEMTNQLLYMAAQQQVKPEKLVKQLRESGGLADLQRQILHAKVLDFLELKAQVEEVAVQS